jgi:hypothetical protein
MRFPPPRFATEYETPPFGDEVWRERGAEQHRYAELKAELATLVKHFPHLDAAGQRARRRIDTSAEPAATIDRPRRRRRGMSAAARRAVSLRMKKYWAARRKAKGG